MGIPLLTKIIYHNGSSGIRKLKLEDLSNKVLAIDGSMCLYTFLTKTNIYTYHLSSNKQAIPLDGLYFRVLQLLRHNVKMLFVFDGERNPHKIQKNKENINSESNKAKTTLQKPSQEKQSFSRNRITEHKNIDQASFENLGNNSYQFSRTNKNARVCQHEGPLGYSLKLGEQQNTKPSFFGKRFTKLRHRERKIIARWNENFSRLQEEHINKFKEFLSLVGIPTLQAKSESEAQCAMLNNKGLVDAVVAEDMDTFAYNTQTIIRGLMKTYPEKQKIYEFRTPVILKEMGMDIKQFRELCIMLGCDYTVKISTIGSTKALSLISKYKNINTIIKHFKETQSKLINGDELEAFERRYEIARKEFETPNVYNDIPQYTWNVPQYDRVLDFMIENGCKETSTRRRVRELRESEYTSTPNQPEEHPFCVDFQSKNQ